MAKLEIRKAIKADAACIALLGRTTFTETFDHFFGDKQDLLDYFDATFSVDKIERSLDKPNNIYWLAMVDGLPVGFTKLKMHSKSEFIKEDSLCQLQKIYVLKDFLSMKIGFELQNVLLETAKEQGFKKIWLSVLGSNERANRFYKQNGFTKIGSHSFQIGKEHFAFNAMSKELG